MKILIGIFISIILPSIAKGQNLPACDTLVINCCSYNIAGANTVSLTASNSSSVLFDYPGFMVYDTTGNIIAVETVVYFGIGTGPQQHDLTFIMPVSLPFTGELRLYTNFYNSLACTFPIILPDSVTAIDDLVKEELVILGPNPVLGETFVLNLDIVPESLIITDVQGRVIPRISIIKLPAGKTQINVGALPIGPYFIHFVVNNQSYFEKFVKL